MRLGDFEIGRHPDGSYQIEKYLGNDTVVTLPTEYNGIPITTVFGWAFEKNNTIQEVIIPEGYKQCLSSVFYMCNSLRKVTFPNSLTFYDSDVIDDCENVSYTTYDNAKYIGNETNPYLVLVSAINKSISHCNIHKDCKIIGGSSFFWCENLESIDIPDKVVTIQRLAFQYCFELKKVHIGSGLKVIECNAFYSCGKLKDINIPDSVTYINIEAFADCESLLHVSLPKGIKIENISFDDTTIITYRDRTNFQPEEEQQKTKTWWDKDESTKKETKKNDDPYAKLQKRMDALIDAYDAEKAGRIVDVDYKLESDSSNDEVEDNSYVSSDNDNDGGLTLDIGFKITGIFSSYDAEYKEYVGKKRGDGTYLIKGVQGKDPDDYVQEKIEEYKRRGARVENNVLYWSDGKAERHWEECCGEVVIPAKLNGLNVTGIEKSAFAATEIEDFKVEKGCLLDDIGDNAFYECKELTTVKLPKSLSHIGKNAFYKCPVQEIRFEGTKAEWNAINLDAQWRANSSIRKIICSDGYIDLVTGYVSPTNSYTTPSSSSSPSYTSKTTSVGSAVGSSYVSPSTTSSYSNTASANSSSTKKSFNKKPLIIVSVIAILIALIVGLAVGIPKQKANKQESDYQYAISLLEQCEHDKAQVILKQLDNYKRAHELWVLCVNLDYGQKHDFEHSYESKSASPDYFDVFLILNGGEITSSNKQTAYYNCKKNFPSEIYAKKNGKFLKYWTLKSYTFKALDDGTFKMTYTFEALWDEQ